ncbi:MULTISPECIES: hypothetical protein [unclassified Coleofasciculus]|uniref:hypothetical protein n=1 Tax=unclassified Coleofasciculus TaxID=2692782 RepID=UPI0018811D79|nr:MULTISPECIES: hypothetical protein [unclassified Coleofasciculus]MBE9127106.1 hypothetical protein [Coleofasciculus sp. LEGE 07081]MBE9150429.1 hypothetical protein [Coleofasciculus sp. LEGE 07092]
MASKPNSKNTKAQILEAYEELFKDRKALETQLKQMQKESREKSASENNGRHTGTNIAQAKMSDTIENLFKLKLGFGSAVSELSEKLSSEASKLQELRNAVADETQQLEDLHDLADIDDDTLDNLIQSYEENSKAFEDEISQRREALEQEIQDLRKAWQKEQDEHQRAVKERNDEHSKNRQRDAEEYKYDLERRRNLDRDTYEQQQKSLYKELEEAYQVQQKQWADREKAIAEREQTFEALKMKVEGVDKEKESAVNKAKEEGKAIANNQVKVKADLQNKEVEGQKYFYELRIQSLEETIQNQEARIHNLSQQLDAALKQVQDLAVKAIEGASNSNSYQALKEIALEQAKTQMKGK